MAGWLSTWTNHDGGYIVCSHVGCSRKASSTIVDHDCCGRCSAGSSCLVDAQGSYAGPGGFAHDYWETVLSPGECATCGESRAAH